MHNRSAVFARSFQLPLLAIFLFLFFTRLGDSQESVFDRNGLILETLVEISLATAITVMNLCKYVLLEGLTTLRHFLWK